MYSDPPISGGKHDYDGVARDVNNDYSTNYYATPPPGKLFVGVPARPTLFFGRADLLGQLASDLQRGEAAVTTHGVGGMGKTALATMLVYNIALLERFSDGVLWASVGPNPDLVRILNNWGEALGLALREVVEIADKVEQLQRTIGQRPLLIVLDDVWDKQTAVLLRKVTGSSCAHLLTTREYTIAHAFAPAACRDVGELDPTAAVDLLAKLCPKAESRRDLLGQLAADVGNHPLALQLVGGYLNGKIGRPSQAERIIADLRQSRAWLTLRVDDRDANLDQILALSLDALPEAAQRTAFLRLAAFAPKTASFSFAAAQAVAACDEDTLTLLLHRNLLEQPPDDLERLSLHQTLHALASAHCPDLPAVRRAHANFYLALMNEDRKDWQTIEAEWEQIKHAWAWVSSTAGAEQLLLDYIWAARIFQQMRGYWREQIAWIEAGLNVAHKQGKGNDEATLLNNIGAVYDALGDKQLALDYFQQALPISRAVGDRSGEATALNNIGAVYSALGDNQLALDYYQQALPISRAVGDRSGEAVTLTNIGLVYSDLGDNQVALDYYQQALPIRRAVGDRSGEAVTRYHIAMIYVNRGDYAAAVTELEQVVALDVAVQHPDLASDRAKLEEVRRMMQ